MNSKCVPFAFRYNCFGIWYTDFPPNWSYIPTFWRPSFALRLSLVPSLSLGLWNRKATMQAATRRKIHSRLPIFRVIERSYQSFLCVQTHCMRQNGGTWIDVCVDDGKKRGSPCSGSACSELCLITLCVWSAISNTKRRRRFWKVPPSLWLSCSLVSHPCVCFISTRLRICDKALGDVFCVLYSFTQRNVKLRFEAHSNSCRHWNSIQEIVSWNVTLFTFNVSSPYVYETFIYEIVCKSWIILSK